MSDDEETNERCDEREAQKRFDTALKRMLTTPRKPIGKKKKAKVLTIGPARGGGHYNHLHQIGCVGIFDISAGI
jgi:hypothetical protein